MKPKPDCDTDRILSGLRPPAPPDGLREKVIAAAAAPLHETATRDRWSRLWSHRGMRFGWAATVILLVVGHLLVGLSPRTGRHRAAPRSIATRAVDEPLADLLRSERISEHVQPIVGRFAAAGVSDDLLREGNDS